MLLAAAILDFGCSFRTILITALAGLGVGAKVYMLTMAALLTYLGRIEHVKSANHFVSRMSIVFYLIAQHILTLDTVMPPFIMACQQDFLSSTVVNLVYWAVNSDSALKVVCVSLVNQCCCVCVLSNVVSSAPL